MDSDEDRCSHCGARRGDVPGEGNYHMGMPTPKELRRKHGTAWWYGDDEFLCGVFGKKRVRVMAAEVQL